MATSENADIEKWIESLYLTRKQLALLKELTLLLYKSGEVANIWEEYQTKYHRSPSCKQLNVVCMSDYLAKVDVVIRTTPNFHLTLRGKQYAESLLQKMNGQVKKSGVQRSNTVGYGSPVAVTREKKSSADEEPTSREAEKGRLTERKTQEAARIHPKDSASPVGTANNTSGLPLPSANWISKLPHSPDRASPAYSHSGSDTLSAGNRDGTRPKVKVQPQNDDSAVKHATQMESDVENFVSSLKLSDRQLTIMIELIFLLNSKGNLFYHDLWSEYQRVYKKAASNAMLGVTRRDDFMDLIETVIEVNDDLYYQLTERGNQYHDFLLHSVQKSSGQTLSVLDQATTNPAKRLMPQSHLVQQNQHETECSSSVSKSQNLVNFESDSSINGCQRPESVSRTATPKLASNVKPQAATGIEIPDTSSTEKPDSTKPKVKPEDQNLDAAVKPAAQIETKVEDIVSSLNLTDNQVTLMIELILLLNFKCKIPCKCLWDEYQKEYKKSPSNALLGVASRDDYMHLIEAIIEENDDSNYQLTACGKHYCDVMLNKVEKSKWPALSIVQPVTDQARRLMAPLQQPPYLHNAGLYQGFNVFNWRSVGPRCQLPNLAGSNVAGIPTVQNPFLVQPPPVRLDYARGFDAGAKPTSVPSVENAVRGKTMTTSVGPNKSMVFERSNSESPPVTNDQCTDTGVQGGSGIGSTAPGRRKPPGGGSATESTASGRRNPPGGGSATESTASGRRTPLGGEPFLLEEDEPFLEGTDTPQTISKERLEILAKKNIEVLANKGEYVTPVKVEKLILQNLKIKSLSNITNVRLRRIEDLESVRELSKKIGQVDAHITASVALRNVVTLFDLLEGLREGIQDNKPYSSLRLGPITKNPVVQKLFGLRSGCDVLEITCTDVYMNLRDYVRKEDLWKQKIDITKFMEFLQEKYEVEDVHSLGVKIRSAPLCMSMIKRAQGQESKVIRNHVPTVENRCKEDLDNAYVVLRNQLLMQSQDGSYSVRQHYCSQTASNVLTDVMEKLVAFLRTAKDLGVEGVANELNVIQDLNKRFKKTPKLVKEFFKFAVIVSNEQAVMSIQDYYQQLTASKQKVETVVVKKDAIPRAEVVDRLLEYLNKTFRSQDPCLTLNLLKDMERNCALHFQRDGFLDLGHESFLHFLLETKPIRDVIEEHGGVSLGGGNTKMASSVYRPKLNDIVEIVLPAIDVRSEENGDVKYEDTVEMIVCYQYKVDKYRHLGLGPVRLVLERLHHVTNKQRNVVCEAGVCYDSKLLSAREQKYGILGPQTVDSALDALLSCPLLDDLGEWSQWDLVFAQERGNLKDFVEKCGAQKRDGCQLAALEIAPGRLLRITTDTDDEKFREVVSNGNPREICGHLVSLIVARGFRFAGLALVANVISAHLHKLCAVVPGAPPCGDSKNPAIVFVRDCLCILPLLFCEKVAEEVFILPLSPLLGNIESKTLLGRSCSTPAQMNRLTVLGHFLGVDQWKNLFQKLANEEVNDIDLDEESQPISDEELHDDDVGDWSEASESESETECVDAKSETEIAEEAADELETITTSSDVSDHDDVAVKSVLEYDEADDDATEGAVFENDVGNVDQTVDHVIVTDDVKAAPCVTAELVTKDAGTVDHSVVAFNIGKIEATNDVADDGDAVKDVAKNVSLVEDVANETAEAVETQVENVNDAGVAMTAGDVTINMEPVDDVSTLDVQTANDVTTKTEDNDDILKNAETVNCAVDVDVSAEATKILTNMNNVKDDGNVPSDVGNDVIGVTVIDHELENDDTNEEAEVICNQAIESAHIEDKPVVMSGPKEPLEKTKTPMTDDFDLDLEPEGNIELCKRVIDHIRRSKFGIGVKLDEMARTLFDTQQAILKRSLKRLADELYTKHTHFVLELVQNADDNSYDDNVSPSMTFVLEKDQITVLNNEIGFQANQTRALCDVGNSTKPKNQLGFIGQKGIGFKSVFRITDRPEVHSNGFHFRFDMEEDEIGYILPYWISNDEDTYPEWQTRIVLPLKTEIKRSIQSLVNKFKDIHPSLLLFLHRLRNLTVDNRLTGKKSVMKRRDRKRNVVELKYNNKTQRWLVVRQRLDTSKLEKCKKDVLETELALAFQLGEEMPEKQSVFAFLPLRDYGFRFVIQGDFDLPSSREDLDSDSAWNQWLRKEIAPTFVQSLSYFMNIENDPIQTVKRFLMFVPSQHEIMDFFKPVAKAIFTQLSSKEFVPNIDGNPRLPSQLIIGADAFLRDTFTNEMLEKFLNISYIHPDIITDQNSRLLQELGVKTLATSDLMNIVEALTVRWGGKLNKSTLQEIAKIFVCIRRNIDDLDLSDQTLELLKDMRIIPVCGNQLVTLNGQVVFFPMRQEKGDVGQLLAGDLVIVEPKLMNLLDPVANSQVRDLLERMGVREMNAKDVIQHHILPVYRSQQWHNKGDRLLHNYVVFLYRSMRDVSAIISYPDLSGIIQLPTNHGWKNPSRDPIHFGSNYGNPVDLQRIFPGYKWCLLENVYEKGPEAKHWKAFFKNLGVIDFLAVRRVRKEMERVDLKDTIWKDHFTHVPDGAVVEIVDWQSDELVSILESAETSQKQSHKQMQELFALLAQYWSEFRSYTSATLKIKDSVSHSWEVESSFAHALKSRVWLPGSKEEIDKRKKIINCVNLYRGEELYSRASNAEPLLSIHVPYLDTGDDYSETRRELIKFLGVKVCVDIDELKTHFLSWTQEEEFETKSVHLQNVYKYFNEKMTGHDFNNLMVQNKAIFIPNSEPRGAIISGKFRSLNDVCWTDPDDLFARYRKDLETCGAKVMYSLDRHRELYPDKPHQYIPERPALELYRDLLATITSLYPQCSMKTDDVVKIYEILANIVGANWPGEWTAEFRQRRIVPTRRDVYVTLEDHPMIADNEKLENLFAEQEKVHFLDFCPGKKGKRNKKNQTLPQQEVLDRFFRQVLGTRLLSESLEEEIITIGIQPYDKLKNYFHYVVPNLQLFLRKNHDDVYESLCEKNIAGKLASMMFFSVTSLEAVYRLNQPEITVMEETKCYIKEDDNIFYVHKDFMADGGAVLPAIAEYFSCGDESCSDKTHVFLMTVHASIDDPCRNTARALKEFSLKKLPSDEVAWHVEKVEVYQPTAPKRAPEAPAVAPVAQEPQDTERRLTCWPPPDPSGSSGRTGGAASGSEAKWPKPPKPDRLDQLPDDLKQEPATEHSARKGGVRNNQTGNLPKSVDSSRTETTSSEGVASSSENKMTSSVGDTLDQKSGDPTATRSKRQGQTTVGQGQTSVDQGKGVKREPKGEDRGQGKKMEAELTSEGKDMVNKGEGREVSDQVQGQTAQNAEATEHSNLENAEVVGATNQGPVTVGPLPISASRDGTPDNGNTSQKPHSVRQFRPDEISDIPDERVFYQTDNHAEVISNFEVRLDAASSQKEIGRSGEDVVYKYLFARVGQPLDGTDQIITAVKWLNEEHETGLPYDIALKTRNGEDEKDFYIEVKATMSEAKMYFESSVNELIFAREKEEQYHLYRVFSTGDREKVKLVKLRNVAAALENKSIRVFMVV